MAEYLQLNEDEDAGYKLALDKQPKNPTDQRNAFMALARQRFTESAVGEFELRARMLEDREFAGGGKEQWRINGKDEQAKRWSEGKPAVTTNQIPSYTRQVTNSIREARPAIQYVGVDDDHDPEMAEVLQGLARHVEQQSMADVAWETASEHMVEGGRGWVYAQADYLHDETTDQEIKIKRVRNPEVIFPDPAVQEFDYSDMRYLHHVEDMPLDSYNRQYPDARIASISEFDSIGTGKGDWCWGHDRVRVSNYYYIEHVDKTLVAVAPADPPVMPPQPGGVLNLQPEQPTPGQVKLRFYEDLNEDEKQRVIVDGKTGALKELRKVKVPRPMFAKINGVGIIDGNKDKTAGRPIPGRYIPYVPVIGAERDLDGKVDLRGMVRDMRDAQQMVNYWQSELTHAIGKVTKGTWVIAEGQVNAGNKRFWDTANKEDYAYLPYAPVKEGGTFVQPPRWESQAPEVQAIVVALQIAENKLRAVAGFYGVDEQQEQQAKQSGRAILARQQQGERGASHFTGNVGRAVRHMGRILLWMYPDVYDTARIKRIIGDDDEEKQVQVYSGEENKPDPMQIQQPQSQGQAGSQQKKADTIKSYDLSNAGRYDVRITVGPSMATKRQEAAAALLELSKVVKEVGVVGADLIVKNQDFAGAAELAKRLKRVVVPKEALDDDGDDEAKLMKTQQAVMQLTKVNDLLTKELNAKNQIIENEQLQLDSKERMQQNDLASKERIAEYNFLTQLEIAALKVKSDEAQTDQQTQLSALQHLTGIASKAQQQRQQLDAATTQHREKLGAASVQQQRQLSASAESEQRQRAHEGYMSGLEALREQIMTGLEHSQEEHMAEVTASQQQEAQEREIEAQQEQAKQQPQAGQ